MALEHLPESKRALQRMERYLNRFQTLLESQEGLDLFGDSKEAQESRRPKRNDSVGMQALKYAVGILKGEVDVPGMDKLDPNRMMNSISTLASEQDRLCVQHSASLLRAMVDVYRVNRMKEDGELPTDRSQMRQTLRDKGVDEERINAILGPETDES